MKRLFTFFALLLMGIGISWADTFTFSAYLSGTEGSPTTTNATLSYYSDEGSVGTVPAGTVSGDYYYSKMNSDKNYYVLKSSISFQADDELTVYLYASGSTQACCIGKKNKTELTASNTKGSVYALTYTLTADDIEDDGTLRIYRKSSNTYFAGVSVTATRTISSDETVQTYPYTWDYTDADMWTASIEELNLYSGQWNHTSTDAVDEYRPAVARSDWGFNITNIKGLRFNTASVNGSPCLDYKNQQMWVADGTTITIPSLKAGYKITVTGTITITGTSNATGSDGVYVVDADGDVTLTFNSSWIKTIVVSKAEPTVAFATAGDQTIDYTVGTFTNVATATCNGSATGQTITYTSSDENVATVDANGVVTFVNSGKTTITATAASTDTYEEASASYTLTVQGSTTPTLSWMQASHLIYTGGTEIAYGNYPYCYAESSDGRTNITYESSNESVVKVSTEKITINNEELTACKINPVRTGEATIYANLVGSGSSNPTQVALTVTITQGTTQIAFTPTAGTINAGCTVTPNLSFPNMLADDVTSFTAVSSDESVATVTSDLKETGSVDGANYLRTVYPVITGVSAGTATITVTFESNLYENVTTTYTVTVVEGDDVNFYWTMNGSATGESKTITINEGDFIMLPAITGMSNGNNSYSDCSNKKYVYGIKNGTVEYNNRKNYKLGEGVPDISVGNESTALVFYAQGQSTAEDSLMVYGRAAGTTYLRATDPQTGNSCSNITLVVKSGLESAHTSAVAGMYFPYTWDFSDMNLTPITTELDATGGEGASWRTYNDTYYMADGIFNADYDDKDNNGSYRQENAKIVSANGEYMKIFNGLKINLAGKDYWKQKHDRLRVAKDGSHIAFIGGRHAIVFPSPEKKPTNAYKLFIKGKGTSSSSTSNFISLTNDDQANADYQFANNETKIVSFDASDLTDNTIYVQNMQIEWMAFSTQAKSISSVNYATYSEKYDLDFEKTKEAQGVQTFAVSSTSNNKAYLTELKYAKASEGFVIKNSDENKGKATDYYYISIARNLDNYATPYGSYGLNGELVDNMLVGTPGNAAIADYKETGDVYFLSKKSYVEDANGQEISGTSASYLGFFKAARAATHSNAYSAFLLIPPSASGAKYFLLSGLDDLDDVAPTSIDNGIVSDEAAGDGVYYNLNGMRVEKPGKGVYVRNGKKVIIK